MDHLEEIRARMSIEELVGGYVQLKKAGRNLRGLCPFHSEKTPSFMVSPEKGIAYCFGCHQGGDIFKFTQLTENVSFSEALKILAQKTNVSLPQHLPQVSSKRLKSIEINRWAIKFYQEQLEKNENQKNYFLNRGLTEETIKKFELGFAPDSFDQLKNYLVKKGFESKELIEAAVLNQRSIADKNTYDRFRNRLMFPIFDHQDNPVGFSGRISGEGEPKYLNSPETTAYNKSLILYGLNWAKECIKKEDFAIFVEGNMDVIACHQAGTENVIATSGTATTPQQLKLIKRYTQNIAFAFDQDAAGKEATLRAIELAKLAKLPVEIILIPNGKDPDDCIKENPEIWREAVKKPISIMDFYLNYALGKFDKEAIEGKKDIISFLLPILKIYETETEKSFYLNKISIELQIELKHLWNDLKKAKSNPYQTAKTPESNEEVKKKVFSREEILLGFIFSYPHLYEEISKNLIDNIAIDPNTERFYNALKKVYTLKSSMDLSKIREELSEEEQGKIDIYSLLTEESYPDFSEELVKREVQKLIYEINRKNLYNVQKEYEFKIRTSKDMQETKLLLNRLMEISKLRTKI